ncbi:MAG: sigma-70 family RNA polymerase sigma factor [Pirellulales bacterium]
MESESSRSDLAELLSQATGGEAAAHEQLLRLYRPFLRISAERQLPGMVKTRADASDIVQQTLLDATRGLADFRGRTEPEFTAWINKLLERNLLQSIRNNTLGKRDVRLEQNWGDHSGSAQIMWQALADDGSSPLSVVVRGEDALQLAMALDKLPADQRTAVEMRYIGQQSLQAIAAEMQRSVGSVAGLIRRGVEAMQAHLPAEFGELA